MTRAFWALVALVGAVVIGLPFSSVHAATFGNGGCVTGTAVGNNAAAVNIGNGGGTNSGNGPAPGACSTPAPVAQDGSAKFCDAGTAACTFSGAPTTAGDIQLVQVASISKTTFSSVPGNAAQIDFAQGSTQFTLATYILTGTLSATPSFTAAAGTTTGGMLIAVKGASCGTLDGHSATIGAGTATGLSTAVTPTVANDGFFAMFFDTGNGTLSTPPAGYTQATGGESSIDNYNMVAYYLLNPPLTSQQPTMIFGGASTTFTGYVNVKNC